LRRLSPFPYPPLFRSALGHRPPPGVPPPRPVRQPGPVPPAGRSAGGQQFPDHGRLAARPDGRRPPAPPLVHGSEGRSLDRGGAERVGRAPRGPPPRRREGGGGGRPPPGPAPPTVSGLCPALAGPDTGRPLRGGCAGGRAHPLPLRPRGVAPGLLPDPL